MAATARKGDLILVESTTGHYHQNDGWQTATRYEYGVVSSATREGTGQDVGTARLG